jgi:DNA polymerase-3 subunit alpha
VIPFDQIPKEVWIQFQNKEQYFSENEKLIKILQSHKGTTPVVIFCREERAVKRLSPTFSVDESDEFIDVLHENYGFGNVKVLDKPIDNFRKMH